MTTVELRPATAEDYAFAYGVHRAAMRPSVKRVFGWKADFQARYFRLHFDPAQRKVIRYNGADVGVFSVEEREESLFIALIAILPHYQNRGIGTALVRQVQEHARESGKSVTLQVLKGNRARQLYERLGFVLTGETKTHQQMRWTSQDQESE